MNVDLPVGRRAFLRLTGMSAGLIAVSQLRVPPAVAMTETPSGDLHVLSGKEANIFAAIADRITFTGDSSMPRFRDTGGVRTVDTALRQLDEETGQQFRGALVLFQYCPPVVNMGLSLFTNLSEADQDTYLRCWEHSRFETPRLAFGAFKNLAMLGYYADDSTWQGINYGGPWAPRPRRVLSVEL